ncbi:MAG: hypothetical protein Q8R36_02855 [bacterium]|nr:hypothetical protein [bacterium]
MEKRLKQLLTTVYDSPLSAFYRNHFKKHNFSPVQFQTLSDIEKIPILNWKLLSTTPLLERIYTKEPYLTKIIYKNDRSFLVGRTLADIALEDYGLSCTRPLMLFSTSHEGVEKGLWFFEHNILPAINEENLELTAMIAAKYEIDGIVAEMELLKQFLPRLQKNGYNFSRISNIKIIDTSFDISFLKTHFPSKNFKIILGLPETGAFAKACPKSFDHEIIVFHPNEMSILEFNETILVTRLLTLPTPIIRYQTNIFAEIQKQYICTCEKVVSSFSS